MHGCVLECELIIRRSFLNNQDLHSDMPPRLHNKYSHTWATLLLGTGRPEQRLSVDLPINHVTGHMLLTNSKRMS